MCKYRIFKSGYRYMRKKCDHKQDIKASHDRVVHQNSLNRKAIHSAQSEA